MPTQLRELCGIRTALQTYDFFIIGSPFPLYLYCDHRLFSSYGPEKNNFLTDFPNTKSN